MSIGRTGFVGFCAGFLVGGLLALGACAKGQPSTDGDCGNGSADPGEQCDGLNLGGLTCETLPGRGFTGGELLCDAFCNLDMSGCLGGAGLCGNDVRDGSELCDGADLSGQTCESLGMVAGTLTCLSDCSDYNMQACTVSLTCGNAIREGLEDCDQTDLGGTTCEFLGYLGGTLDCQASCLFDLSGCHNGTCGDGVAEGTEECDGLDLGGATCVSLGHSGGPLACSPSCTYDETLCGSTTCGDGVLDAGEACDGTDLGGEDCVSQGFSGGGLACAAGCLFDTSQCTSSTCGDGVRDTGEDCDGADLGGETCATQGFGGGSLACSSTCTFDTTACTSSTCGNATVEAGEECDDGNTSGGDGCSATCTWEQLCSADEIITCGSSDYMSSVSGNDSDNYSCSSMGSSADRIYALTIGAGTTNVTASLTCDDTDDDFDIYILEGACNGGLCVDYGASFSCDNVSFGVTAGLTYYIVVEDYSSFWGGVTLNVSCN